MQMTQIKKWALSTEGREIALWNTESLNHQHLPRLLLIGGTHGDEPEGVRLAQDCLKHLLVADPASIGWQISIITCLNPDGISKNQRTNGRGVDLNRNYPSQNWSPVFKEAKYYPGPNPASEPEIQAVVSWIQKYSPKLIIHFHSWKPCVVCTGEPGKVYAQELATSSGYALQTSIGYETPGGLSQFGWHDLGIPIICTEEQEHSPLNKTWENFGPGLIRIFKSCKH